MQGIRLVESLIMFAENIQKYIELLGLNDGTEFIKIDHEDAMVATVYKVTQPNKLPLILKICDRVKDYSAELYFLSYFSGKISVPNIINTVEPDENIDGAILMEYLAGGLLKISSITKELAFEIGQSLALIHENSTSVFGYLTKNFKLNEQVDTSFIEKFEEGIEECKLHIPASLTDKVSQYYKDHLFLLDKVDGPCIIHRDFRPGNIIIQNNKLQGIIDWSSARSSFAEDDFCSIEHGEWGNFNGHKSYFINGYAQVRPVPNYTKIMPLLRLNRAIAVIGFTVKSDSWDSVHADVYNFNRQFLDNFNF